MILISKIFYLCGGIGLFGEERFDEGNEWRVDLKNQIEQITSVVQTNSATAEESAATSQELSTQASVLKQLVKTFHLRQM